jgi:predicted peroxiredoxin
MTRTLIHLTHGPQHPVRAARAFEVTSAARNQGQAVTLFLTSSAVRFLCEKTSDAVARSGTGELYAAYASAIADGASVYASSDSVLAEGVTPAEAGRPRVQLVLPRNLAQLAGEYDQVFSH